MTKFGVYIYSGEIVARAGDANNVCRGVNKAVKRMERQAKEFKKNTGLASLTYTEESKTV